MKASSILTPAEAAKEAECSRPAIMQAIKSGALTARKNNSGRWDIHDDDLKAWLGARRKLTVSLHESSSVSSVSEKDLQIVRLQSEVQGLQHVIETQRSEIEFLRDQVRDRKPWWQQLWRGRQQNER